MSLFLGCSDDSNPFTPENLILTELAYFPLKQGYKADYTYQYTGKSGRWGIEGWGRKEGSFHLEVVDTYTKESKKAVFYKISTRFILKAIYNYTTPTDTFWISRSDSMVTAVYDIMLKNSSLWKVENAPSFDRLDEGDTTLMMASPIACGGELHLDLFPVQAFGTPLTLYEVSSYDESLGLCGYYQYPNTHCNTVKNKGIVEIEYMYSYSGASFYDTVVEKLELRE